MTTKFNATEARALVERLTGYTPGPWRERGGMIQHQTDWIDQNDTRHYDWKYPSIITEMPEAWDSRANGYLIAAAPDLHRHLTAALAEIERLREGPTVKESARVLIPVFEKSHEDWARSKGRNPKDYVSHHTTTLDALRALAGETDQ